jgi:hypothetical protein
MVLGTGGHRIKRQKYGKDENVYGSEKSEELHE